MHLKTLRNLVAWGKGGKVATLRDDLAKLQPHFERVSAKNKAKWAEVLKTYEELLKAIPQPQP